MAHQFIAGVDEAGRGALAGPVVAAAVILPESLKLAGLTDSKKLSRARRDSLATEIIRQCVCWAYSCGDVEEINEINILRSTLLSMKRAIEDLDIQPDIALIDGNQVPDVAMPTEAVIKGDLNVPVISAASILAKTTRDRIMYQVAIDYPQYGFESHVGYGTEQHLKALRHHGAVSVHRTGFSPVREVLEAHHRLI